MATVTVHVERGDHLKDFQSIFNETSQPFLVAAMNVAKAAVQKNAPVYQGVFRASIATSVQISEAKISGTVFSQDTPIKVNVIEEGRRPGSFAPVDVITRWVQLVIRPPAKQLRGIAFLINRAIARRGIKGRFPFKRGYEEAAPEIRQILEVDFPATLAKRL